MGSLLLEDFRSERNGSQDWLSVMAEKRICDECGAELPTNAPEGLCPRCLAAMGIGLALASEQPSPGLGLDVKDQTPEVGGQPPLRRSAAPGAKHGASGPLARLQGGNSEIRNQTAEIQKLRLRYF